MNKTVNINLGGMFFHIDEDAYQKLTRYFDAIKRSLSNSSGQDEIIRDIEMRIGELIAERHSNDKQVINMKEVDEIIGIMGQPEDYRLEDDGPAPTENFEYTPNFSKRKKLYRDVDHGLLGGVSTGLGQYFGIDAVWIRIIFAAVTIFSFGAGAIPYIILWIAMPAAITTSEKLEMTGEPVTISNIQKKVREEMDYLSEKYSHTDFDRLGKQAKTGAERFASNLGEVFLSIFKVFGKIIGGFLAVVAGMTVLVVVVGFFVLLASIFFDVPWMAYAESVNYTNFPMGVIVFLGLLALGIPFFFLFLLGMKLLVTDARSVGNPVKYTLLALWLIAVGVLSAYGIKQGAEMTEEGKTVQRENIAVRANDTLAIGFRYNDYFAKDIEDRSDLKITQDEKGQEVIFSNNVRVNIRKSPDNTAYMLIEKRAHGKSMIEVRKRAETITYSYKLDGKKIVLDNYFVTNVENKLRDQEIEIFVYVPEGIFIKPDETLRDIDNSDDEFFNLHYSGNYLYKVAPNKVMCLDCPKNENEFFDIEGGPTQNDSTFTTTVSIGNNNVTTDVSGNNPPSAPSPPQRLEVVNGVVVKKTK